MDAAQDIRELLTSRRAKISPADAGLPVYGSNRRVKGLRREEVAMLAGIIVEYDTRLGRGNANGVSEDVLEGVVRALQLDEAERAHLFDLVRTTAGRPPRSPLRSRPTRTTTADLTTATVNAFTHARHRRPPCPTSPRPPSRSSETSPPSSSS